MIKFSKIIILFILSMIISFLIFIMAFLLKEKKYSWEKVSPYECGFQAFEDTRNRFEVKFYLVAILFIIFDLEIAYLFPWALSVDQIGFEGVLSMIIFLFILTIGFLVEWKKGALDWE